MHHHGQDAHLRRAAVVELDRALLQLRLLRERFPLGGERVAADRHVPRERTLDVLHHAEFKETNERHDLQEAQRRELRESREAVRHVRELQVHIVRQVAGESVVLLNQVSRDGEHGDAAVLDLHVPETVEALLVLVDQEAQGVVEAEGGLRAELALE